MVHEPSLSALKLSTVSLVCIAHGDWSKWDWLRSKCNVCNDLQHTGLVPVRFAMCAHDQTLCEMQAGDRRRIVRLTSAGITEGILLSPGTQAVCRPIDFDEQVECADLQNGLNACSCNSDYSVRGICAAFEFRGDSNSIARQ